MILFFTCVVYSANIQTQFFLQLVEIELNTMHTRNLFKVKGDTINESYVEEKTFNGIGSHVRRNFKAIFFLLTKASPGSLGDRKKKHVLSQTKKKTTIFVNPSIKSSVLSLSHRKYFIKKANSVEKPRIFSWFVFA